jgi:hypothetical protein
VIVLAFVVLLAGLVVAYLTRTGTNRQLAQETFNETNSDQLARAALDIIVADFKQEINNGSTTSTVGSATIYAPSSNATIVPQRSGTQAAIPNLIRAVLALI